MRALIFANGNLNGLESHHLEIRQDDLLIAADGGASHLRQLNLLPHLAIGDFDSITKEDFSQLENSGVQIIRHPQQKDFTDLELALDLAVQKGAREILIYAALGYRWDQTLANLLLPVAAKYRHVSICLIDGDQQIFLVSGSTAFEINGAPGDTVSLIPISGDATGVSTQGLEYPLTHDSLYFASTRGISNVMLDSHAQIKLEHGQLICVVIHHKK